jgi:UDP-N-acetylmuramate dehydrogenase
MIKENVDLKPFTYFKIGGPAKYFADVETEKDLHDAVKFAKANKLPFCILGAASNVLCADTGYHGVIIRMLLRGLSVDGTALVADAGVPNAIAVARAVKEGLAGFEWAVGIPGTIGGSIRGNAGCFSGEMKDVLEKVRFFNTEIGETEEEGNEFCKFRYRDSVFKAKPELVILSGSFRLRKNTNPDLSQRLVRYYSSLRSDTQDIGSPSAGCVFKNPYWPKDESARKRLLYVLPALADFAEQETIPAGFLVDHLGLKGKTVGRVSVSKKHGNYLINHGGATAEEVIMLIGIIKEHVHRKYNLQLDEEIQYIGF